MKKKAGRARQEVGYEVWSRGRTASWMAGLRLLPEGFSWWMLPPYFECGACSVYDQAFRCSCRQSQGWLVESASGHWQVLKVVKQDQRMPEKHRSGSKRNVSGMLERITTQDSLGWNALFRAADFDSTHVDALVGNVTSCRHSECYEFTSVS